MQPKMPEKEHRAYFLRTSDSERKSHGGFQWPVAKKTGAYVKCNDWNKEPL